MSVAERLAVLEARRSVLSRLGKTRVPPQPRVIVPSVDVFEFETQGARVSQLQPARRSRKPSKTGKGAKSSRAAKEEKHAKDGKSAKSGKVKVGRERARGHSREPERPGRSVKNGRVTKAAAAPAASRLPAPRPRTKANWTEAQDRLLREYVRKWGNGQWKRMERSGKFPKEYTAVMIKNRAMRLAAMTFAEGGGGDYVSDAPQNTRV